MINPEKPHSEYFEELCALAASGFISETEFVELRDHLQGCAECRSTKGDFVDLLHNKLPLASAELTAPSRLSGFLSGRSLYRARFLSRARKLGLPVSHTPWPEEHRSKLGFWLSGVPGYALFFAGAVVVLLMTTAILSYSLRQGNIRYRNLAWETAAIRRQIDQRQRPIPSVPASETTSPSTLSAPPVAAVSDAGQELINARQEREGAEAHAKILQAQNQETASELQAAKTQISEAIEARNQLESKLRESEQNIAQVNRELQSARENRSKDAAAIAAQGLQIRQLSEGLSSQMESLERERSLLAAGRDIHDLMGARNLHIVDVQDVDSKGKDSRTFGRVFYTEGKSLIFYAFDLGDRTFAKRNASFQVWGARGPAQIPAQSLGIFYVDDQKQNRWVLRFEDPDILAEIDSVFVTVEPPGGSTKPTGHKFLYAYLKANPNHP